jgi:hypothetical protein
MIVIRFLLDLAFIDEEKVLADECVLVTAGAARGGLKCFNCNLHHL